MLGPRVDAGQRVLVLEDQRLVAAVERDPVQLLGLGADRPHEVERPVDVAGQPLVAAPTGTGPDEVGVPRVHLAQVGVAALQEGPAEVERRRRRVVDLHEPLRVGTPAGSAVKAKPLTASPR